jgi:hypothetical protein
MTSHFGMPSCSTMANSMWHFNFRYQLHKLGLFVKLWYKCYYWLWVVALWIRAMDISCFLMHCNSLFQLINMFESCWCSKLFQIVWLKRIFLITSWKNLWYPWNNKLWRFSFLFFHYCIHLIGHEAIICWHWCLIFIFKTCGWLPCT